MARNSGRILMGKHLVLVAVCLIVPLLLMGCKEQGVATATCGDSEVFESRLGTINVPQLALGQYFLVNRTTEPAQALSLGRVNFRDSDIAPEQPIDTFTTAYSSKLNVSFSANIPEAAKGALATAIQKTTELTAQKIQRRSLYRVLQLLSADATARKDIFHYLTTNKNNEIHVVNAVRVVDKLDIALAGGATTTANVSVVQYGNFELQVAYQCDNILRLAGHGVAAFFTSVPLGLDTIDGPVYLDSAKNASLAGVDLGHLFDSRYN